MRDANTRGRVITGRIGGIVYFVVLDDLENLGRPFSSINIRPNEFDKSFDTINTRQRVRIVISRDQNKLINVETKLNLPCHRRFGRKNIRRNDT